LAFNHPFLRTVRGMGTGGAGGLRGLGGGAGPEFLFWTAIIQRKSFRLTAPDLAIKCDWGPPFEGPGAKKRGKEKKKKKKTVPQNKAPPGAPWQRGGVKPGAGGGLLRIEQRGGDTPTHYRDGVVFSCSRGGTGAAYGGGGPCGGGGGGAGRGQVVRGLPRGPGGGGRSSTGGPFLPVGTKKG